MIYFLFYFTCDTYQCYTATNSSSKLYNLGEWCLLMNSVLTFFFKAQKCNSSDTQSYQCTYVQCKINHTQKYQHLSKFSHWGYLQGKNLLHTQAILQLHFNYTSIEISAVNIHWLIGCVYACVVIHLLWLDWQKNSPALM